jgi:hypothetical protein
MRHVAIATLLTALVVAPEGAPAQEMVGPPKVLLFEWETIKPGTGAAHDKVAAGFAALAEKTKSPGYWIGTNAVSGDENKALFLGGFPSFAAVQKWREADEAAAMGSASVRAEAEKLEKAGAGMHVSQKAVYATYQEDVSYHAPGPADIGKARFVEVTVTRIKPGRIPDYWEFLKTGNQAREKAGFPGKVAVFLAQSGAPTGTVLLVRPLGSLAELDADFMKPFIAALGGDEGWKKLRAAYADVAEESTRTLYALNPKISRPHASVVAADPGFWTPPAKGAKAP